MAWREVSWIPSWKSYVPRRYSEGGRTLGLITRAVRAEAKAESSGDGGREKQQRSGPVNFLKTKKPLFILGRTNKADVAEREGKVTSTETYKGVLLSAGLDKEGRKKVAGLTIDRISFSSYGVDNGWYRRSTKGGQLLAPTTSDRSKKEIEGQSLCESSSGTVYLKSLSSVGLGMGKRIIKGQIL